MESGAAQTTAKMPRNCALLCCVILHLLVEEARGSWQDGRGVETSTGNDK